LTDFSCCIFENDISEALNGHTIKVLAVREVNHRKKPGGDSGSSIRGHMKYATEQFVREFLSQEIKKSEQVTKTYIDKKINELDIKLSNKIEESRKATEAYVDNKISELKKDIDNLQKQINTQEKILNEQNILLKKIANHFNL